MRKLLTSLAGLTLIISTTSGTVVACGAPSTNQATKESNQVNHKTVTLNESKIGEYEGKSAATDAYAIDQQLEQSGYLASYQAKDFHFNPSQTLALGPNQVNYSVQTSDGSTAETADGSLNVTINLAQSSLTPAAPSKAKTEASKANSKTVTLYDTASVKYEGKSAATDADAIDQQLEKNGILTKAEAQDFHYDGSTKLQAASNTVNYTVKASDGSTANGSLNVVIQPYTPTPPTPSKAKTEANKVNGKTIDLNDTATKTYESQTAQANISAIDDALVKSGLLDTTEVKDFTFNNTVKLVAGDNNGIDFTVKASDHTQATGSLNIHINPYKPTPPTPSKAQAEANKVNGKTVDLNDTASVKYENKTANDDASPIKTALTQAGDITTAEAADFTFDNTKPLASGNNNNIGFTVNASDKSTATGSLNIVINPYKPTPPPPPSPETAQAIAAKIINKKI